MYQLSTSLSSSSSHQYTESDNNLIKKWVYPKYADLQVWNICIHVIPTLQIYMYIYLGAG